MSTGPHGAQLGRLLCRLVEAGVVDAEAAFEGRVSVSDLSRSHAVGLVQVDERPAVVIKGDGDAEAIAAEAAAYRWLAASPTIAGFAPEPLAGVAGGEAIVTRPVLNAISLHEALGQTPDGAGTLITRLGRLLGAIHVAPAKARDLPARRPWILGVPAGSVPAMYEGNEPACRMVEAIADRPAVAGAISELDRGWTARTAIHGDVKFDNVLVTPDRLVLVDWELTVRGEPVWDLAGVVDGLLLPRIITSGATALDPTLVSQVAEPALAAHRAAVGPALSPTTEAVATAVVARLAQTATQLAAMGRADKDAAAGAMTVWGAVSELAETLVGRGREVAAWTS